MQADVGWVEQELNEVRSDCRVLKDERDEARADSAKLRDELGQVRSQLAELTAFREELHRSELEMELEKVRWEQQLTDARAELADAKATILKQGDEIRELQAKLTDAELKQNSTPANELPEAANLLNELKSKRKKSRADLADVVEILEILGGDDG
ncbi:MULTISPECIES: hypothetical protein [unclassified Microcoleus]|uniref:hypothetical protein n=1 Tax=unclassified Microcoleus TaxID=2642155 RepID=UPI002FD483F1